MKKIVWLASWYPNDLDELTGDFIKRHAQACSLFQPVYVIHVKKNNAGKNKITLTLDPRYPNLTESICYYKMPVLAGFDRLFSYIYSLLLYHKAVKNFIKQYGRPNFLHVHVMLRCGLVALYYKWVHKIPYVVTEHYAGYMPGAKKYMRGIDIFNYLPLKLIAENACAITTVSLSLAQALKQKFSLKKINVIPNVVNTDIFYPVPGAEKNNPVTFLHVSTLTPQKDPEQMLSAFALLKKKYNCAFELWVVGPEINALKQLAETLEISTEVKWFNETSQQNIALLMQMASALVLYSRFETFGCVNIEAMACGLPVIVSDIPVFKEYLEQGVTAWFAKANDAGALAGTVYDFCNGAGTVNAEFIAGHARQFDYVNTGSRIAGLYRELTDK